MGVVVVPVVCWVVVIILGVAFLCLPLLLLLRFEPVISALFDAPLLSNRQEMSLVG